MSSTAGLLSHLLSPEPSLQPPHSACHCPRASLPVTLLISWGNQLWKDTSHHACPPMRKSSNPHPSWLTSSLPPLLMLSSSSTLWRLSSYLTLAGHFQNSPTSVLSQGLCPLPALHRIWCYLACAPELTRMNRHLQQHSGRRWGGGAERRAGALGAGM